MKTVSLSGSPRESVGKKDAKALRRQGRIPAVLYGGDKQYHCHLDSIMLEKLIFNPDVYQLELTIGDTTHGCIIKDIQYHPVTDKVVHVDFLQLLETKPITVLLPVHTHGSSVGVLNGGILMMNFRKIPVKALPKHLPELIDLDITKIKIGGSIRVRDISIPDAVILLEPSAVLVAVKTSRAAMSLASGDEEEGEEGAEEGAEEGGDTPAATEE
jgi:large subunit ribosomal protein L25